MSTPGRLILMGSGELAPALVKVHRHGIEAAGAESVVVMDSPFGFQENAPQLTGRIHEFFETSLGVGAETASYRHPDDGPAARERLVSTLRRARYVFSGPGSPSYALARWREAEAGPVLHQVLASGGTVTLASAAALTAGRLTIPVYEIYKVGADPYWLEGLDLTSPFGFALVAVPHWNNREGGDHDTSHCYIGGRRFALLERELDFGVLGIDEHTAAIIDFGREEMTVEGVGEVLVTGSSTHRLRAGDRMDLAEMIDVVGEVPSREAPAPPAAPSIQEAIDARDADALLSALLELPGPDHHRALRAGLVETVEAARRGLEDRRSLLAGFVELALDLRREAREAGDYARADRIRDRLVALGVKVGDSPQGTTWELADAAGFDRTPAT